MTGFAVLGPVRLLVGGAETDLGPAKQRCVLAVLLMRPNWAVPAASLIEKVWGDRPPKSPHAAAPHVTRLRKLLPPGVDLRHTHGGYRLGCDPALIDLHRARRLSERARAAGPAEAADLLGTAVADWSLEPLAGIGGAWAARTRAALTAEGLDLRVRRAGAQLALERYTEVIDELRPILADHPCAEDVAAPLMRALARAGRPAEALACYARVRTALSDQLGADPSQALAALHLEILRSQLPGPGPASPWAPGVPPGERPAEVAPEAPVAGVRPGADVPAQLPADVAAFTGRSGELAGLRRLTSPGPGGLPIVVIAGTGGVGKTALAVHWAHRARDRFPDGQLYVNLRGYGPDRPLPPEQALTGFLGGLGVADRDIPAGLDDRAARYRSATAGRRVLVVLDNAATAEQVRPLLPGTPTAVVLVTSRDSLAGLVAGHGASRLELHPLPAADATELLRRLIGERAEAETAATGALVGRCAGLPLALRVAAELAAARRGRPIAELAAELADEHRRLDLLGAGGDPRAAVKAVFSWSYRHLRPDAASLFRLLGLHPGPHLDAAAAAALVDTDVRTADRLLAELARAYLVRPVGATRYGMHDLLRIYAAGLAAARDTEPARRAASERLFDHYEATAAAVMDGLYPSDAPRRPRVRPAGAVPPELADPTAARAWLDAELTTLTGLAAAAAATGRPARAVRMSATLNKYLQDGHGTAALAVHGHAAQAAAQTGDLAGQAGALLGLGVAYAVKGYCDRATELFGQALAIYRQTGDRSGEARALSNLGSIEELLGRYHLAAEHATQAADLAAVVGDHLGRAHALGNLGYVEIWLGRYAPAAEHLQHCLDFFRSAGDQPRTATALANLGLLEQQLGRYGPAAEHHRTALLVSRRSGYRTGEAWALTGLGEVHLCRSRAAPATASFDHALALFRQTADRVGEAWALNGLGEASRAAGRPAEAVTRHAAALALALRVGSHHQQIRAHRGLATAHGAPAQA